MSTLTLVVDERELSTIRAALLLLEQTDMLPEDLAEMMREHGPAMTEAEIEHLSNRMEPQEKEPQDRFGEGPSHFGPFAESKRFSGEAFPPK